MVFLKQVAFDIRFWIILFFVLRLYAITEPPLEVAHHWRQVTVAMTARNFLDADANIFYPRVDFAGEKTGITGMEFPFLNYLIYLVSLVFGYAHWYGRLINLVVSSIGLLFFYRIVKKYFTPSLAFNATFILLFSVWFTYSRKIMPDTFSMSVLFIGIYYGGNYLDVKRSLKNLLFFFLFALLGILSKLPSICIVAVFCPLLLDRKINLQAKIVFCFTGAVILSIVGSYYFFWVPYLTEHYGFYHFFMGKSLLVGFREIMSELGNSLEKFYLEALQIIGFILFLSGLVLAGIKKNKTILCVFSFYFFAFLIVVFKAGLTFSHHSYYVIPVAPIMALLAAYTLENIRNKKIVFVLLTFILLEGVLNKFHDFFIKEKYRALELLEPRLDLLGTRNDRIIINSGDVPTPMYFAHRKGWISFNERLANPEYIAVLKSLGLKHIVILKKVFSEDILLDYEKVYDGEDFAIYQP